MAIKILLNLSSKHHRRRYARIIKFDLTAGVILGLFLPWIEIIGLVAAAVTAVLFLGLSILMMLESKSLFSRKMKLLRKESIRESFLHFSITTWLVGILTTLLSIVVPPFLKLSLGFLVPLAFDSLSVLSALLEFTLPSTPYTTIFALTFELISRRPGGNEMSEIFLEDIEEIAYVTAHNRFEFFDAIKSH
ncbi:MAG: hypothetical protein QXN62_02140 [Candidatus Bathyarchaeia archaeon]|nr:hypothetical protein [Candidatus Bathyarchaeota archaeon]